MQDNVFLNQALEQAFLHPIVNLAEGMSMNDYTNVTDCLRFGDDGHHLLLPCAIANEEIKKYATMSGRAVHQRHNPRLYEEYETYKHDISENIVVPYCSQNDTLRQQLNLPEVNRQAAQRKKITATIFPHDFTEQYLKIHQQYIQDVTAAEEIMLKNQEAYDVSLIVDFAVKYTKIIRQFNISNLILWINKKRFRFYLNEAAQLLKSHQVVSIDFYENHPFRGEKYNINRYKVMQCKNNLKQLLFLLQKMAHNPELLNMVQAILAKPQNHSQIVNEYRLQHKNCNVQLVGTLRHNMQDLFNKYAFLTYLNGVRFAFENKFLRECPVQKHPPLPTVSPQNEIKKIIKIVEESRKISAGSGKITQIYAQALKDYNDARQKLITTMSKFF